MLDLTIKATLLSHMLKELDSPAVLNLSYVVKDLDTQNHEFYSSPIAVDELESKLTFLVHHEATSAITITRVAVDLISEGK
jgi:hypothetical protein